MDIRFIVMISIVATTLAASGCAGTEETRTQSGPSMKEMPSSKDMPAKTKETPTSPVARESAPFPSPTAKEAAPSPPSTSMKSTPPMSSDPLQACLAAAAKGSTAGQRDLAEQTCRRDYGNADPRSVSSGTQGDTVEGCLARIPKDATAGQRMLAEQSCARDEETRRGF